MAILKKLFSKRDKKVPHPFCSAVVVAAGSHVRMCGENKILAYLDGVPVLMHSLMALNESPLVDEIIIVAKSEDIPYIGELCGTYEITKATKVVAGGATRKESSYIGVNEASSRATFIAIHDGARPLVTAEVIENALLAVREHPAVAPAIPVTDTVKCAENRLVADTPDRSLLFSIQTPQVFDADIIKGALKNAMEKDLEITDDCSAAEALGVTVYLSEGSPENIKITTPIDLHIAESILYSRGTGE